MHRGPAGRFLTTSSVGGETVRAFVPEPLPLTPPLALDGALRDVLDSALLALGRLDSVTMLVPDTRLLLCTYVRKEAVLSSQIEGTQSSFRICSSTRRTRRPAFRLATWPRWRAERAAALPQPPSEAAPRGVLRAPWTRAHRGGVEEWVRCFADGVRETATGAVATAQRLVRLFQEDRGRIQGIGRAAGSALRLHEALQERPPDPAAGLAARTGLSMPAVNATLAALQDLGVVREITGRRRNRLFSYEAYLQILSEGTEPLR